MTVYYARLGDMVKIGYTGSPNPIHRVKSFSGAILLTVAATGKHHRQEAPA